MTERTLDLIYKNYIYINYGPETVGEYFLIPSWPDQIRDSQSPMFAKTNALSRSAPVFAYSYTEDRTVNMTIKLHRDMFDQINFEGSNVSPYLDEDYVETFIRKLQAIAVPKYNTNARAVQPPSVACRIGNELFIKGVVTGTIKTSYEAPILDNGHYANVSCEFTISETSPYDAETIMNEGSFRGFNRTFRNTFLG